MTVVDNRSFSIGYRQRKTGAESRIHQSMTNEYKSFINWSWLGTRKRVINVFNGFTQADYTDEFRV